MIGVTENLAKTNALVTKLCHDYERDAGAVRLIAVSKKHSAEAIAAVAACGQHDIGENFVTEALDKRAALADIASLNWHFIGALQSNKTRSVAENFDWVHTIDRLKIAERLNAQRPHHAAPLKVLIQINIDGETSKSGIAQDAAIDLAREIVQLPSLELRGLMCLPRPTATLTEQRQPFARLAALRTQMSDALGCALPDLSMGMSGDLEAAIAEGATQVRVGTAIFGPRPTTAGGN